MIRGLVHETTQHSPRYWSGPTDLRAHVRAAAATGYAAILFDRWSLAAQVASGASVEELAAETRSAGLTCAGVCALSLTDPSATAADLSGLWPAPEALGPEVLVAVFRAPPDAAALAGAAAAVAPLGTPRRRVPARRVPARPGGGERRGERGGRGCGDLPRSWHLLRGPEQWDLLAATPVAEIADVQIDDALPPISDDPAHETTQRRTVPGEGELDLRRFGAALDEVGYAGWIGVEVLSAALWPRPLSAVARWLRDVTHQVLGADRR